MERRLSHVKRRKRVAMFMFAIFFFLLSALGIFVWFGNARGGDWAGVVMVADPVSVLSWDKRSATFTLVTMPTDAVVESSHGYGFYPVESLWNLGAIEGKVGTVLAQSLEETLGLPVRWYIGGKRHTLLTSKPKEVFSLNGFFAFLRGSFATNMPPSLFWQLAWAITRSRPDSIRTIDLSSTLVTQMLADGSQSRATDANNIDVVVGSSFEDDEIRKESIAVAVYNTTESPALGTRVGRLLSHLGMRVVAVANDTPEVNRCTVSGKKKDLESLTAKRITLVYDCLLIPSVEAGRADIVVRVGKTYQARFLPFGSGGR